MLTTGFNPRDRGQRSRRAPTSTRCCAKLSSFNPRDRGQRSRQFVVMEIVTPPSGFNPRDRGQRSRLDSPGGHGPMSARFQSARPRTAIATTTST